VDCEGDGMKETPEEIAARVAANLPSYLRQTPEQAEEDKRAQELRRASFTRSKLTGEERLVARGAQVAEIALANIGTQESLREEGHNVSSRGGANKEMLEHEYIRLAHGLELQGRYKDAASVHPLKREQARLLKIEEAIAEDDAKFCGCAPTKTELNGQEIEVEPHYEVKRIFSRRHRGMVSLVGCTKCSALNATPALPSQLASVLGSHTASHVTMQAAIKAGRQVSVIGKDAQLLGARQSNS
jgi:hypothetical protein